ncbi:MAG: cyclase family protein [Bryobacteraceae bacterium]
MKDWIDISLPLQSGMPHWPGDPVPSMARGLDMDLGDICNARYLTMSAHTGTHMDAPLHFVNNSESIDRMPLTAAIGPARVIRIEHNEFIGPEELEQHNIQPGERILFKTGSVWDPTQFKKTFVACNAAGARHLVERKVQTVGIDYLSIGAYEGDGVETHQILLGAGIWVIEGLDLTQVEPGNYDLICLPLKILGGDGAPARAVVRKIEA